MVRIKSVFKYAFGYKLIERPVDFGPEFTKPSCAGIEKIDRRNYLIQRQ
jgi:hypothetical protein